MTVISYLDNLSPIFEKTVSDAEFQGSSEIIMATVKMINNNQIIATKLTNFLSPKKYKIVVCSSEGSVRIKWQQPNKQNRSKIFENFGSS